jgi:hypothetical protein
MAPKPSVWQELRTDHGFGEKLTQFGQLRGLSTYRGEF